MYTAAESTDELSWYFDVLCWILVVRMSERYTVNNARRHQLISVHHPIPTLAI